MLFSLLDLRNSTLTIVTKSLKFWRITSCNNPKFSLSRKGVRCLSISCVYHSVKHREKSIKERVFLPKTAFKIHVPPIERSSLDSSISFTGDFDGFYQWQLNDDFRQKLPLFRLLDGPPYANGDVHVGHAINKILKDFILRSRVYIGNRVEFVPGWDCHGLPIELKVNKELNKGLSPVEIRRRAQLVAERSMSTQKASFRRWGVLADWDHPYYTMHPSYVARQLRLFAKLYGKGLVYRAYKPVYWSPSSKTALAESELEYKENHESTAVYYRFEVINGGKLVQHLQSDKRPIRLFALIWTTTPWTLPLNDVIAFRPETEYALIEISPQFKERARCCYIIARNLIKDFEEKVNQTCTILGVLKSDNLDGLWYRCCMFSDIARPFVSANHVATSIGTGLVHTSYAHGFQDYEVGKKRGDQIYCYVDEEGRYTRQLGYELENKPVLSEGQDVVLNLLKKHVIHAYSYVHSYPYDWRTNKPVIIRSSAQWFMDVFALGVEAVNRIERNEIQVGTASADLRSSLMSVLENRSAWCISRQRCWGVPIPVLYKEDKSPILSEELIEYLADRVEQEGSNIWWTSDINSLFPEKLRKKLNLNDCQNIRKGEDVMDVWMDSGLAWGCTDNNHFPADLIVEGIDQFRGWFQSLLLTSLALKRQAPFKRVLVHGFAVDEHGKKMSKSIGNVIHPHVITDGSLKSKALGADGLRLWVALYGSEGSQAKIGPEIIQEVERIINNIRTSLRFLLGGIEGLRTKHSSSPYFIDRYILFETDKFVNRCMENYEAYRFRMVANSFIQFLQRPLSSNYIQFVKDRLYCGCKQDRHYAQETLATVGLKLIACIAPIMPHLATEFFMFHPCVDDPAVALRECHVHLHSKAENADSEFLGLVDLVDCIRSDLRKLSEGDDTNKFGVILSCGDEVMRKLRKLQVDDLSFSSELTEALRVSLVNFKKKDIPRFSVQLTRSPRLFCTRCRKYTRIGGQERCSRCTKALEEDAL